MIDIRRQIETGINRLNLSVNESQLEQYVIYLEQMERWNRSFNLTAVRDINQMIVRHLFDSLAIAPFIHGGRLIDIGTGGGLPGLPLAITYPDKEWFLLDSNGKKTRFLVQLKATLGLSQVDVIHSRAELFKPDILFDGILSRAFASIADMINVTAHLLKKGGLFYAMKAGGIEQELNHLPENFQIEEVVALTVPGLEAEQRHLIIISTTN